MNKPVVETLAATVDQPTAAQGADLPAVPGYRVLREIARGGMGRVLAAHDLALDREVAVKILLPGANADRFVRESKITARLPHPGIPPVHALGTLADGSPFLAMKLIAGQTLAAEMQTADPPRLLQAFAQVCQAVGFAHSRGVIHRDLKPANVMVGAFGEVQVMDWGLAKDLTDRDVPDEPRTWEAPPVAVVGADSAQTASYGATGESTDDQTRAGQVMGTPAYMAPEQARGEATDARADVFALGGILCAVLTGGPPFSGRSAPEVVQRAGAADLAETWARLDGCGADVELVALCKRCLSPSPADRPADGQAVADEVTAYLNGVQERLRQAELAAVAARARAAEEAKRRRLTLALAATVLLAVTLGGGAWLWVKADRDARQVQVAREVHDAVTRATALFERAKSAPAGGATWFAQAREQAQRASALAKSGPADDQLKAQVRSLQAELDEEEKDLKLLADLDAAWLAQAELVSGENRFAQERAVPMFRKALQAYGLPAGEGGPEAAAARIRERPARVRATLVAALDDWIDLAANPKYGIREPHLDWLRAVVVAAEPQDDWTRRFRAARQLKDRARLREALEKLAAEVRVDKLPALSLTRLAGALQTVQAEASALRLLRRTQEQHSGDFWVNQLLGLALLEVKPPEHTEAARYLMAAVALRPESPGARINLGSALMGKGEVDEAIACGRKAIALDPKYVVAHTNLGSALLGKGEADEAIAYYRKAIALDPRYAPGHTGLGDVLRGQGKVDEAIACYRKAIARNPKYATAHLNLGNTLASKGQLDHAIDCLRQAITLAPQDAKGHYNLGVVLSRKGDVGEAIASFRKAIAVDPQHAPAHSNLGVVLAGKGQVDEAITHHQKAVALSPKDAMAHTNLGTALAAKGRLNEAIDCWRQAIALEPKNVKALGALGLALFLTGRYAEARDASARALALLPEEHALRAPVSRQISACERFLKLEARLPRLLRGEEKPGSTQECLDVVALCRHRRLHAAAVRFAAEAFAADPNLADDLRTRHRDNAARAAALAAAGQGEGEPPLDAAAKAKLRRQALDWLRADLMAWDKVLQFAPPQARPILVKALSHWQQDSDFAGIRDEAALAGLTADERAACTRLWADVAELLKKAKAKPK